jgi:carbon monoxide dehydrogenase subunit G
VLEPGHLVFIGTNDGATSTDDIQVTSLGVADSEVIYRASLKLRGVSKLATPVVKVALERIADRTASQMSEVISAL